MTRSLRLLAAAIVGLGVASAAQAGRIDKIDCNIDVYNLTGQDANDFDIRIGGVAPSEVIAWQGDRAFPQVTIGFDPLDPTGTLIHYFGAVIPDRGVVHIGHEISPSGPIGTIDQYWTWEGANIGRPDFLCSPPPEDVTDGTIRNTTTSDLWLQRRPLFVDGGVVLDDLLVTGPLWTTTPFLDASPVKVAAGGSLGYSFGDQGHGTYLMMYQVCADSLCTDPTTDPDHFSLRQVMFTAVHYTPEPGSLALLLGGIAAALATRRRRRPEAV